MSAAAVAGLPANVVVLERGWLSSNNILVIGADETALIDTGYVAHAEQTVTLVESALDGRPLDRVLNTHLHATIAAGTRRCRRAIRPFASRFRRARRRWWSAGMKKR